MKEGQATLKDLAAKLGISISSVSRALKDHPDVNSETKSRVQQLAKQMEYEPNQLALNLLKSHSNLIGVIVPKLTYHLYATAICGIEEVMEREGYHLMICQTNESFDKEVAILKEFNAIRPAGYLISPASQTKDFDHLKQLQRKRIPLVLFNRDCLDLDVPKVIIDNKNAAFKAVHYLLGKGYKKVAFLGGPENLQISNQRIAGYQSAMQETGSIENPNWIKHANFTREDATEKTKELLRLKDRPDAIIAFSDQMAISAILAIREAGFSILDEFAIMGFNNEPGSQLMEPALTSIDQPAFEMGKKSAEKLMSLIHKKHVEKIDILHSKLIPRKSTGES